MAGALVAERNGTGKAQVVVQAGAGRPYASERRPFAEVFLQRRLSLVNAAFLLVTSAWLAGGDAAAAAPVAATAAPIVSSAPCSSCGGSSSYGGCNSCDSGCGCEKEGFFARLRAKFARGGECGCGCESASSCGCAAAAPTCGCEKEGFFSRLKGRFHRESECGCASAPVQTSCGCASTSACGCESGPSLWERLKGRFHHSECGCESGCNSGCNSGCSSCGGATGAVGAYGAPVNVSPAAPAAGEHVKPPKDLDPGKKLPEGGKEKEVRAPASFDVAPVSTNIIEKESKSPFDLDRRYENRVERAADYSRLTGQLFFVHADGGLWVLRYASLSNEDANGGGVVLARDRQMDSYREGDLVTVHGEILNQRGSKSLGAPLYQASSIELVERANP
jgi:hypothetical protein